MDQHFTSLAFSSMMTKWMLLLKTAMDSSFQLINDTDSSVILTWYFHTDPLLRVKTWLDPTVGRRGTVVIRLETFCWSGKPFPSTFRNHCINRSESGSPAFALPQGRLLPFPPHYVLCLLDLTHPSGKRCFAFPTQQVKSPWKYFHSAQTNPYV